MGGDVNLLCRPRFSYAVVIFSVVAVCFLFAVYTLLGPSVRVKSSYCVGAAECGAQSSEELDVIEDLPSGIVSTPTPAGPAVGEGRPQAPAPVVCEARQSCNELLLFPNERCGVFVVPGAVEGEEPGTYRSRIAANLPRCVRGDEEGRWLVQCPPPPVPGSNVSDVRACDWKSAVWQPFKCSLVDPTVEEARSCLESVVLVAFGDSTLRNILNATLDVAGIDGIGNEQSHDYWDCGLGEEGNAIVFFLYNSRCFHDSTQGVNDTICLDFRVLFQEMVERMDARIANSTRERHAAHPRRLVFFVGGLHVDRPLHAYVEAFAQNDTTLSRWAKALGYETAGDSSSRPRIILKSRSLVARNRPPELQYSVNADLKAMVDAQPPNATVHASLLDVMQIHHGVEHLRKVDACMCHFTGNDPRMPPGHRVGVPVDRETGRVLLTLLCPSL